MKGMDLLDSIEMLDLSLIEEADADIKSTNKKLDKIKIITIAAALFVTVGIVFIINNLSKQNRTVIGIASTEVTNGAALSGSNSSTLTDTQVLLTEEGIFIPPVDIPSNTDGIEMDMIGLVVYRGGIYTQASNYRGDKAVEIKNQLIGDYLGYATGSIDEWASEEDLQVEFSSSIEGEIYSVKGYDTDFRICVIWESEGENGEGELQIEFLDRLNGITLNKGSDLFEDRLHLNNRIVAIQYQSHNDWDYAVDNISDINIDENIWNEFMNSIYSGDFVYTWDEENYTNTIYDTDNQAHILLTMEDGTTIWLRLIEGGYVGYDSLGWYFVQIPGDVFDNVFEACR